MNIYDRFASSSAGLHFMAVSQDGAFVKYDDLPENNLQPTSEWFEDYSDCLFFHFDDFESAPIAWCGSPLDDFFDNSFWTHFIRLEFNSIIEQAMAQEKQ